MIALKYPFTPTELQYINKAWECINIINTPKYFITDYREYVINQISSQYPPNEFLIIENVINKLFWNLRWAIAPLWENKHLTEDEYYNSLATYYNNPCLSNNLLLCQQIPINSYEHLHETINNIMMNNNYYRSFINKLIIYDNPQNILYVKDFEGSAPIFSKNYFNLYTMTILFNQNLYQQVMENPYSIKTLHIDLPEYYYQLDYAFPNLNFITYDFGTEEERLQRILKMYYHNNHKYWYKLLI